MSNPKPATRPKWVFYLSLILLNLLTLFVIDRLFGHFFPAYPTYLNKKLYTYDSYTTNPRNYFDVKAVGTDGQTYYTIDRSHEENRKYELTKIPKNANVILAIGDSFTYGQGVKLKDTYVKRLEHVQASQPIYGINYAISGANIKEVYQELVDFYSRKNHPTPSVVIYGYVLNDPFIQVKDPSKVSWLIVNNDLPKEECKLAFDLINLRTPVILSLRKPVPAFLARNSRIFNFALAIFERRRISAQTVKHLLDIHDPEKNTEGIRKTLKTIQMMKEIARRHGSHFLVAIFPIFFQIGPHYPFLPVHTLLTKRLGDLGVDALDLFPAYRGYKDEDLWVHPVDQHPNDLAQYLAAKKIETWLRAHALLH